MAHVCIARLSGQMAASGGPISAQLQQVLDSRPDEGIVGAQSQERREPSNAPAPPKHAPAEKNGGGGGGGRGRASHARQRPPESRRAEGAGGGGGGDQHREDDPRTLAQMYDRLIMGIIRPPRMSYEYPRALGPSKVVLPCGVKTERTDFEVVNARGHHLQCSLWKPDGLEATGWPCVICLHGNSSSRLEAAKTNVIQTVMLAHCALVGFDFSGCGNSDGDMISLGYFEAQDTGKVVDEIRRMGAGRIVLWGRSMGAVTALLYASSLGGGGKGGSGDSSSSDHLAGLILDSPFSSFRQLALDLTSKGMVRIPQFATATVLSLIRRSVKNRAGFDLYKLKPISRVHRCTCPALFLVAEGDELVPPWHGEALQDKYGGLSLGLRFDGTHNSSRPGAIYSLALLFVTAATRRERHPIEHAFTLIEKTAVITSQEEEAAGMHHRHPFRYDGKQPRFVRVGSVIGNFAGAASTLVTTLDVTLACRSVEDHILNELLSAAVTVVQSQLTATHKGEPPEADVVEEIRRAQQDNARREMANEALAPRQRQRTSWEKVLESEKKSAATAEECRNVVDVLRRLKEGDVLPSPAVEASSPPLSASRRAVFSLKPPAERGKSPLMSSGGRGPRLQQQQQNNNYHGAAKPSPVRFCCFDPRDALAIERTREEHLTELARQFFEADEPTSAGSTPPAVTVDAAKAGEEVVAEAEMVQLDKKLSRSQLRLSVSDPLTQETV